MWRPGDLRWLAAVLVVAFVSAACVGTSDSGGSRGSAGTSASPLTQGPVASSFDEFAAEQCAALQSLLRAYGNPDTAGLSPLMQSFADAIERGDATAAAEKAGAIRSEIEDGRAHVRSASGWAPAATATVQLDRMLVAFEKLVEVRLAALPKGPVAAEREGQAAFEAAGGAEAWFSWVRSLQELRTTPGGSRTLPKCEGVPIG